MYHPAVKVGCGSVEVGAPAGKSLLFPPEQSANRRAGTFQAPHASLL